MAGIPPPGPPSLQGLPVPLSYQNPGPHAPHPAPHHGYSPLPGHVESSAAPSPIPSSGPVASALSSVSAVQQPEGTYAHASPGHVEPTVTAPLIPSAPRRLTGVMYDERMLLHETPADETHPECPARINHIYERLHQSGCLARMVRLPSREATRNEVLLVHEPDVWDSFEALMLRSHEELKAYSVDLENRASLYLNRNSTLSARVSCGSVVDLCVAVATGQVQNGFAIVRPPGHHAEPTCGTGFCLYNNVAVATKHLMQMSPTSPAHVNRVLILDWDVHHGNGTQRAFWDDPNVLYISLHRYENGTFYPGTTYGHYDQVGGPSARGRTVNVPWPCAGMTDADYLHAFQHCIMPIAYEFAPDLVIISAGFDAAHGDILGECHVSPEGYAHMTHQLLALAGGKLVVALEGGYTLEAIADSALAVSHVLLGDPLPALPPGLVCSTAGADTVARVVRTQAPYWRCMATSLTYPPLSTSDVETGPASMAADKIVSVPTQPLRELVLQGRTAHLWSTHELIPLPCHESTSPLSPGQALCSSSLLIPTIQTLVVFVHDMGPVHISHPDDTEHGAVYVSDAADDVVAWAARHKYAIMDVNTKVPLPVRAIRNHDHDKVTLPATDAQDASTVLATQLEYIWDNFVSISPASDIVLIGLGTGCQGLMHLITQRAVQNRVRAILQVLGMNPIPLLPKMQPELKSWYKKHAYVLCPHDHPRFMWNEQKSSGKRLGKVEQMQSDSPMHILLEALPRLDAMLA